MFSNLRRLLQSRIRAVGTATGLSQTASRSPGERPRLLFAFNGGNKTWPGLGQQLYSHEEAFRQTIRRCSPVVEDFLGFSLSDYFAGHEVKGASGLEEGERREIVIISAVGLALSDLWRAYGVEPEGVVGLCGGEIAAAYAAGAISLTEAAEVSCSVAELVTQKPLKGHWVWLDVDYEKALRLSRESPARLDVLLDVSPVTSLAYCTSTDIADVQRFLLRMGVSHRAPATDWAYHTPGANAMDELAEKLYKPRPRPLTLPFYSSAVGGLITPGTLLSADHWYSAAVSPAMFGRAVSAALADGYDSILNACAHLWIKPCVEQSAKALNRQVVFFDSIHEDESELTTWHESLRALRAKGLSGPRLGGAGREKGSPSVAPPAADDIDLLRPDVACDPHPHYAALRRSGPVHFLKEHGFWLVLDYDDVVHALKRPDLYSSVGLQMDPVLIHADPPAHTRVRRILSPYFSADSVEALENYMRATAEELLAQADKNAEFDIVHGLAVPLSESVICRFLGLPDGEASRLRRLLRGYKYPTDEWSDAFGTWGGEYLARLRDFPGEDLCSRLTRGEGEQKLAPEEVVSLLRLLWVAGTLTPGMLISTSALMLLRLPAVRAEVQQDLRLLPAFIDEVLRVEPPERMAHRVTREDVEVSGIRIPTGSLVKLCLAAANRDPKKFPEPDRFSLRRSPNAHLSFGAGPHYCFGASLARMGARIALETLLARWPQYSAARPLDSVSYASSIHYSALEHLFILA